MIRDYIRTDVSCIEYEEITMIRKLSEYDFRINIKSTVGELVIVPDYLILYIRQTYWQNKRT